MEVIHSLTEDNTLKIIQNSDNNSYTFDSLLLADFINLKKKDKNIVDLCTGNAPIPLLLTKKKKDLKIIGVELQAYIASLARRSVQINNLDNIEIYNENLKNISDKIGKNKYDIITCNPPYFRVENNGKTNKNKSLTIARHELEVTLLDVIRESKVLLSNEGRIFLVHRSERLDEIILLLDENGFTVKRLKFVHSKINNQAETVLVEATKKKLINNKMTVDSPLIVYDQVNIINK